MDLSRRSLLTSAALAVPATALVGPAPVSATRPGGENSLVAFHTFMAGRRFTPLPPLPPVGGPAATQGYTYDEGMNRSDWRNRRYVVQPCSRVDDIGKRSTLGVLPLFAMGAFQTTAAKALPLAIAFLVDVVGLRRQNLTVTTIAGNPFLPAVTKAGLKRSQVRMRDSDEAKQSGDGSGWFVDPSTGQGNPSMSIEYRRGSHRIEIAEGGICMGLPGKPAHFTFGLERVEWASTGEIEAWSDVLPRLLSYTNTVHEYSGTPMPAGYAAFAASR